MNEQRGYISETGILIPIYPVTSIIKFGPSKLHFIKRWKFKKFLRESDTGLTDWLQDETTRTLQNKIDKNIAKKIVGVLDDE